MTNDRRKVTLSLKKLRKIIVIAVIAIAALTGLALWLRSRVASQFGRHGCLRRGAERERRRLHRRGDDPLHAHAV